MKQAKFESFKASFYSTKEELAKSALKRARATALVLGVATVSSILFLVFAFTVKTNAENEKIEFESQIYQLEQRVEDCKKF